MKRFYFIIAFAALALCACNKVENLEVVQDETPIVYHLSLRAGFDPQTKGVTFGADGKSITTAFKEEDCIYVYNETRQAFARESSGNFLVLHPADISASGTSCTLSGELSFYIWDYKESRWENVPVKETDAYALYYQLNCPGTGYSMYPSFDYTDQDGSPLSVSALDFAAATGVSMTLSGNTLTVADDVQLKNLQSMFRQRLSFTKGGVAAVPGTLSSLEVKTKKGTLVYMYSPTNADEPYDCGSFALEPPVLSAENDVYLSLAFYYDADHSAADDEFILKATDVDGNIYHGSKPVPTGGFVAGKYYYGEMTLDWSGQDIPPTVTRNDGGDDVAPNAYGEYSYNSPSSINITISGNSAGYNFYFQRDATVTLAGNGTAINVPDNEYGNFLYNEFGFCLILAGNYTIDCRTAETAIWADWGDLTLETNTGIEQTLTVIASDPDYRGLYGENYDKSNVPSALAAAGFTVELTSTTPGPDEDTDGNPDYYIWVYTVTPNP